VTGPYVVIEMEREVITALPIGDPALLPRILEQPLGAGLLDIVHPVDRPLVAEWVERGIGVSQPFRRAAADEPPRWFRFLSSSPFRKNEPSTVLMEEVTEIVREDLLRERLSATLARNTGEELVRRSAKVAAELAGAESACLAELHPPLGVVRASHGRTLLPPGTTFPLSESPLSRMSAESGLLEYSDEVRETFPSWAPFRMLGARFAVVLPVVHSQMGELVGGLVCSSTEARTLSAVERELLGSLAVRLGAELGQSRFSGGSAAQDTRFPEMSEGLLRVLALAISGKGITHTLNNLLGGQLLNAELAAERGQADAGGSVYMERVVMASRKGAAIVRRLSDLTGWEGGQREFCSFGPVIEEAVQLIHDLYEANRVEVRGRGCQALVWGDPPLLRSMVLALVAPLVERTGPETQVVLDVRFIEEESLAQLKVWIPGSSASGEQYEGVEDMLQLGTSVAARIAGFHGGSLERVRAGDSPGTSITIPATLPHE